MTINSYKQRGAVSIFIVIFAVLLITVVTVSFVRIMLQDQQQATTTDLSQSAYDSAQAGVEDAKRALLKYQSICNSGGDCVAAARAIDSTQTPACNAAIGTLGVDVSGNEVKVQTGTGANAANQATLDQAYTCVKITLNTNDYLGTLSPNGSNIIPLSGVTPFNKVQIQWFSASKDLLGNGKKADLQSPTSTSWPLLSQSAPLPFWGLYRPSIMRSQMIQFSSNGGFTINDFDSKNGAGQSNANTLFLYPTGTSNVASSIVDTFDFTRDIRRAPTGAPLPIHCSGNLSISGGYACTTILNVPDPINGDKNNRTLFLRLSALYNGTDYRVTLLNGATPVQFNAVQPQIDSTGRANDLFRRVQTRVELTDVNFKYPEAEVDITGSFCKDFSVTDNPNDYSKISSIQSGISVGSCAP
jgi:Tfp pilus assembly protein PilX